MLKAVIFDLDGTLLYTLQDLTNAVNTGLLAADMPQRTTEEIRGFVGNGVAMLIARAIQGGKENPEYNMILSTFREYYKDHCSDNTVPYDGIPSLLSRLKNAGIKTAVTSNKLDSAVKVLCSDFFPELIDTAIGDMDGQQRKPAPDMLYKAMDILNVNRDEVIYVGDSEVDIVTAKNAGLKCISVSWGFKDREFLVANKAEVIVDNVEELEQYIWKNTDIKSNTPQE